MQSFSQILVSELFTIDKPLGLQMMKYNTLPPPLPHYWPSQMPQLFAASRGHSHYYASHPRPHWSIHHSGIILSPLVTALFSDKTVDNGRSPRPRPRGQITAGDECEGWRRPRGLAMASTRGLIIKPGAGQYICEHRRRREREFRCQF